MVNGIFHLKRYSLSLIHIYGEPKGASEDMTDYSGKRAICINCEKILPKKMFEENRND